MEKQVFQIVNSQHMFVITHENGFTTLVTYTFDGVSEAGKFVSEVKLSATESKMLMLLLNHQGRIVSKDEIMAEVWKNKFVTENSIRQVIFTLRRFFFDQEKPHHVLLNSRGVGYTLHSSQQLAVEKKASDAVELARVSPLHNHSNDIHGSFIKKVFSRLLSFVNMPQSTGLADK
jgi:DNA-binding winged helix-turn-helix (wHTH) protein